MSYLARKYRDALLDQREAADKFVKLVEALKEADPDSDLGKAARAVYPETGRSLSDELSQLSSAIVGNAHWLVSELG